MQLQSPRTPSTVRGQQTSPSITTELSLVAFQNEISLNYFLDRYRWAHWWKAALLGGLQACPSSAQYKSSQAIILGYFGSEESSSELRDKSVQLYCESLRRVSAMLSHLNQAVVAESICTIVILGMYPVSISKIPRPAVLISRHSTVRNGQVLEVGAPNRNGRHRQGMRA